jgi:hypothetical protein
MLKYIELKTGHPDNGPAWVARVRASKSGRTLYFNGKALKRVHLPSANHCDVASQEAYWVSGVRQSGLDRRRAGSTKVAIEAGAVEEYLRVTGSLELDSARFEVIEDLAPTDPASFDDHASAAPKAEADAPPKRRRP